MMRKVLILLILALFIVSCRPGGQAIGGQLVPGGLQAAQPVSTGLEPVEKTCQCKYIQMATCKCVIARASFTVPYIKSLFKTPTESLDCFTWYYSSLTGSNYCTVADYTNMIYKSTGMACTDDTVCLQYKSQCPPTLSSNDAATKKRAESLTKCSKGQPSCAVPGPANTIPLAGIVCK